MAKKSQKANPTKPVIHAGRIRFGQPSAEAETPAEASVNLEAGDMLGDPRPAERRAQIDLEGVLREIFPIESYDKTISLNYIKYELGNPRYGPDECRQLRLTYGRPFRVWLRLNKEQPVEEEVYFGDVPIMIGDGKFIINGAEQRLELAAEMRKGYLKLRRVVQERMSIRDQPDMTPRTLINPKTVWAAIEYFFALGELNEVFAANEVLANDSESGHGGQGLRNDLPPQEVRLSSPEEKIKALFADLPQDPRERLTAIAGLYGAMRKEAAKKLQPAITELLKDASRKEGPQPDYTEKARLADQVNQVLADARLSLLDPQTQLPAKLSVNRARPSSPSSTLRLADSRKADDGERHVLAVDELQLEETPIELVEHIPGPQGAAARPGRRGARHR